MILFKSFTSVVTGYKHVPILISVSRMSTAPVTIKFHSGLKPADPEERPVLIVGQVPHLNTLTWNDIRCKLEPRCSEEAWKRGLSLVSASPGESVELWPRAVSLATLPARCSRHAVPARPHALHKLARQVKCQPSASIVLVCRKRDVLASCTAVARSFPLFTARSAACVLGAPPPAAQPGGAEHVAQPAGAEHVALPGGAEHVAQPGGAEHAARDLSVEILLVDDDGQDLDSDCESETALGRSLSPEEVQLLQTAGDATRLAARIADTPANLMHVDQIIQEAFAVAKQLDIAEPLVIRGEELKARGMGGLYGVGQAAASPPALVVLSYTPAAAISTVAWVGKGIVYDTGGLSIKSRTSMVGMKGDCGGAAGVLGAFLLAASAGPGLRLHAVLCLAENAVGPRATRPDDIHTLYSGRTVEINNTDAEGRLVLSDGVVYAQRDLKADVIVDMATLTGAQGTATGKHHAAIVSNSGRLERACIRAGRAAGDAAHALPYAPELHYPEYASHVADMKNSVADRSNAPVSCAGLFMLSHLGFDCRQRWLHIDMAAPAVCGERATGYGVSLLPVLFGSYTRSELLQSLSPGKDFL